MAPSSADSSLPEFSFKTRQRDWDALKANPNQVLPIVIVGGGIVGAGLLRELSLRRVSGVYLFEKNDFASGTSGASSKLIHAGIRYLEQVWVHLKKGRISQAWQNLRFVIQASRERKVLGKLMPSLIKPKPIYLVLSKSDLRSSVSVVAGVWAYYLIQLFQGQLFPPPALYLSRKKIDSLKSELNVDRVKAVFGFWDSETDDARLVIENLQEANSLGGHALNYVELIDYKREESGILLALRNNETGETVRIKTKLLINASGPFVDEVRKRERMDHPTSHQPLIDRIAGSHIDLYPALTEKSYYVSAEDNRLVFVLRRNEDGLIYTRIGTTERPLAAGESSDSPRPTEKELSYLEDLVKAYFPKAVFNEATVIRTDAGIRPLRSQTGLDAFHKSREHDIVSENGVIHVVGVKLTDFRRVAEEVANRLKISRHSGERLDTGFRRYDRIYTEQSIPDIVDRTMPLHWDDFVLRRAGLRPLLELRQKPELIQQEFSRFADCLGWNAERRATELKRV